MSIFFCNTEAQLKMDCDGDVGIGSISGDPAYTLQVRGDIQFDVLSGCKFYFALNSTSPVLKPSWSNSAYIGLSNNYIYKTYSNNVYAYNYGSLSDISIKENIREIKNPLDAILQVKGIQYDLKREHFTNTSEEDIDKVVEEGKNKYGVIAQEIKEILPDLVNYDEEAELYSVNYVEMIPILVEAIKEQQEMIDGLQNEIHALQNDANLKSASFTGNPEGSMIETKDALIQNSPNPFSESTEILFSISEETQNAALNVYNLSGTQLKSIELYQRGEGSIIINGGEFDPGIYLYALITDGKVIDTKQMVLTN